MNSLEKLECYMKNNKTIFIKTIMFLSEDCHWKTLLSAVETYGNKSGLEIISDFNISQIKISDHPSEALLNALYDKFCPVGLFCDLLQDCEFFDTLTLIAGHEPLQITQQPDGADDIKYMAKDESLELSCKATGLPPPSYLWRVNNNEWPGPNLCITFDEHLAGEYYCVISQTINGETFSLTTNPVNVEMIQVPVFIDDLNPNETILEGRSIILKVTVLASPAPVFDWMFEREILPNPNNSNSLVISATAAAVGEYRCVATIKIGNKSYSTSSNTCKLSIFSAPLQPTAKIALLIANQDYQHLKRLRTPINDASKLAEKLQEMEFLVFRFSNLTFNDMKTVCKWFFSHIPKGAYVMVFFGGHGFQSGYPFMMPVDCPADTYDNKSSLSRTELNKYAVESPSNKPHFMFILADMCLVQPSIEKDQKASDLLPEPYIGVVEYKVAYSTSEYCSAYERVQNSLYIDLWYNHLTDDLTISEILQQVHSEYKQHAKSNMCQTPSEEGNLTFGYKLTDPCVPDENTSLQLLELLDKKPVFKQLNNFNPSNNVHECSAKT